MRVAAIYDIHGNVPALEAVLAEIAELRVDAIVIGGDVVPGPMPREAIEIVTRLPGPVHCIRGNGEGDILALRQGEIPSRVPERYRPMMEWVAAELLPEQAGRMATWPTSARLVIPDLGDVLFCHATPRDDNEIFTELTPEAVVSPIFASTGADLVVCGHTHMQFDRRVGGVRVVNAGSAGMPFGEPGAYWLLLDRDVSLRQTPYDYDAAAASIAATDYPEPAEFTVAHPPPADSMLRAFEAVALRG